jgi:hypothetical protein
LDARQVGADFGDGSPAHARVEGRDSDVRDDLEDQVVADGSSCRKSVVVKCNVHYSVM